MNREHYSITQDIQEVTQTHSEALLEKDIPLAKVMRMYLEWLLKFPKNQRIIKKIHETEKH